MKKSFSSSNFRVNFHKSTYPEGKKGNFCSFAESVNSAVVSAPEEASRTTFNASQQVDLLKARRSL
jgi:hypothetical protein